MDDFISYAIIAVVSLFAGWKAREVYAQMIVNSILRQYDADAQKAGSNAINPLNIEIEKHNDVFYVYNTENNSFITQVKSREEMFEFFKNSYPDRTVMVTKEHFKLFETT